ncbi:MAG TPA: hypothetical protein VH681_14715 [Nitrospiraceae bacterium]|nr:hypothetical protein [Nitrospira sp.]
MSGKFNTMIIIAGLMLGLPSVHAADNFPDKTKDQVISETTESHLPGNRLVAGRILSIRGNQMEIDIGNVKSLYVPLRPANEKGQTFEVGQPIIVTLNDHNAIVDYHHPNERSDHHVYRGKLTTPLTVGLDKAVVETKEGTKSFVVTERAKGKLTAIPVGVEAFFLADESGQLVDAQLASAEAVRESAENNKARIKGAHEQLRATFKGKGQDTLKIAEAGKEREVPYRPPLEKLDRLKPGQDVVLLMDDQGYVLEIATPDVPPVR